LVLKLLSNELLKEMLTLKVNNNEDSYGYGMWLEKTKENTLETYFQGSDPEINLFQIKNWENLVITFMRGNVMDFKKLINKI